MRHRTNKNKSAFVCRRLNRLILLLLLLFESSRAPRRSDAREAVVVVVVSRRRRRRRPTRGGACRKRALSAFSCENSTPLFSLFLWGKTCLFFERLDSYFLWYGRARRRGGGAPHGRRVVVRRLIRQRGRGSVPKVAPPLAPAVLVACARGTVRVDGVELDAIDATPQLDADTGQDARARAGVARRRTRAALYTKRGAAARFPAAGARRPWRRRQSFLHTRNQRPRAARRR